MTPAGTFRDDETRAALRAHRDAVIRRNQLTELIAELRATQAHKVLEPRRTVDSAADEREYERRFESTETPVFFRSEYAKEETK